MSNVKLGFSCNTRRQRPDEPVRNTPEAPAEPLDFRARGSTSHRGITARRVRCHPPPAHKTIRFHLQPNTRARSSKSCEVRPTFTLSARASPSAYRGEDERHSPSTVHAVREAAGTQAALNRKRLLTLYRTLDGGSTRQSKQNARSFMTLVTLRITQQQCLIKAAAPNLEIKEAALFNRFCVWVKHLIRA